MVANGAAVAAPIDGQCFVRKRHANQLLGQDVSFSNSRKEINREGECKSYAEEEGMEARTLGRIK
jgi:hypothetical protein